MSESEIAQILAAVARVETKVEALQRDDARAVDDLGRERTEREHGHGDHEQRIRKLEQFKWVLVGFAGAVGGAAGGAVSQIVAK